MHPFTYTILPLYGNRRSYCNTLAFSCSRRVGVPSTKVQPTLLQEGKQVLSSTNNMLWYSSKRSQHGTPTMPHFRYCAELTLVVSPPCTHRSRGFRYSSIWLHHSSSRFSNRGISSGFWFTLCRRNHEGGSEVVASG